jgi:hypothetical protein
MIFHKLWFNFSLIFFNFSSVARKRKISLMFRNVNKSYEGENNTVHNESGTRSELKRKKNQDQQDHQVTTRGLHQCTWMLVIH